jgi:glycosyltransferase involved in cell wall biosynthesis
MNALWHARRRLGGRFAILFTNGGWLSPEHLHRPDLIQALTPVDFQRLHDAGFPDWQVDMVPYGARPGEAPNRTFTGMPKHLIGVGTLNDTSKGFATAIRAAAQVGDVTLRLLGQRDAETPAIESLGATMLGDRFSSATIPPDKVPAELAGADVFVLPTHSEGFCVAVLEAMAAGLPCVVSDIPVLRWLVADAGVCVAPDRADLWVAALRALDAATRRRLSEAARRRAAMFQWSRLVSDYLAMYKKAIAARHRSTVYA